MGRSESSQSLVNFFSLPLIGGLDWWFRGGFPKPPRKHNAPFQEARRLSTFEHFRISREGKSYLINCPLLAGLVPSELRAGLIGPEPPEHALRLGGGAVHLLRDAQLLPSKKKEAVVKKVDPPPPGPLILVTVILVFHPPPPQPHTVSASHNVQPNQVKNILLPLNRPLLFNIQPQRRKMLRKHLHSHSYPDWVKHVATKHLRKMGHNPPERKWNLQKRGSYCSDGTPSRNSVVKPICPFKPGGSRISSDAQSYRLMRLKRYQADGPVKWQASSSWLGACNSSCSFLCLFCLGLAELDQSGKRFRTRYVFYRGL